MIHLTETELLRDATAGEKIYYRTLFNIVKNYGRALSSVPTSLKTTEICMAAIENTKSAIEFCR